MHGTHLMHNGWRIGLEYRCHSWLCCIHRSGGFVGSISLPTLRGPSLDERKTTYLIKLISIFHAEHLCGWRNTTETELTHAQLRPLFHFVYFVSAPHTNGCFFFLSAASHRKHRNLFCFLWNLIKKVFFRCLALIRAERPTTRRAINFRVNCFSRLRSHAGDHFDGGSGH